MKWFLVTSMLALAAGCASQRSQTTGPEPQFAFKGYEVYSWREHGEWQFSLLLGTNRLKSREVVTSPEVRRRDLAALLTELERLPRGEFVSWDSQSVPGMEMPPDSLIDPVRRTCEARGIELLVGP